MPCKNIEDALFDILLLSMYKLQNKIKTQHESHTSHLDVNVNIPLDSFSFCNKRFRDVTLRKSRICDDGRYRIEPYKLKIKYACDKCLIISTFLLIYI